MYPFTGGLILMIFLIFSKPIIGVSWLILLILSILYLEIFEEKSRYYTKKIEIKVRGRNHTIYKEYCKYSDLERYDFEF